MSFLINNMPVGHLDTQGQLSQDSFLDEAFRGTYSGTNLILKGFAKPGASTDALVWQISQIAYDGSGNLISIKWPINANGAVSNQYEFSWDVAVASGYTFI
jgi:hypothetical protein